MYYFALELQRFVEDTYHNRPDDMVEYEDFDEAVLFDNMGHHRQGLLWDRPGWYVEMPQSRRAQDQIDEYDVPAWPTIILGYASNASNPSCDPHWTRKRPNEDFRSVHIMSLEYASDQSMTYRLVWEQSGIGVPPQRTASEYEDSWAIPTSNNETAPSIIPIRRPIEYLFKPWTASYLLNYPYTIAIGGNLDE